MPGRASHASANQSVKWLQRWPHRGDGGRVVRYWPRETVARRHLVVTSTNVAHDNPRKCGPAVTTVNEETSLTACLDTSSACRRGFLRSHVRCPLPVFPSLQGANLPAGATSWQHRRDRKI